MYKYENKSIVNIISNENVGQLPGVDINKLFYGDIFVLDESNKVCISSSPIRNATEFPAVLCLRNNRTYGKQGTKHLYKCVPDDKNIPPFLVPYEMKHVGFSKVFANKYVLIRFIEWTELNPRGMLTNVIGDVHLLDNYYEYQLQCKGLTCSIQSFTKKIQELPLEKVQLQSVQSAITIDPLGTKDFDDAFSITTIPDGKIKIGVHIANVPACLDAFHLWDYVTRVSTIYLPNKSKPMLPPKLSEEICSLVQGKSRNVFTMEVILDSTTYSVVSTTFYCTQIKVSRNYVYEEAKLLQLPEYQQLFTLTNKLQPVVDSHELVAFWMGYMNTVVAEKMYTDYGVGIFRRATISDTDVLPISVKNWKNSVCEYVTNDATTIRHDLLGVDKYLHITSPIRRIVDLVNMTLFLSKSGVPLTDNAHQFCSHWIERLDYINDKMRAIRKVQTQCSLLAMSSVCSNDGQSPIEERLEFDAYLFDKIVVNECTNLFSIYLKSLNLIYKLKTTNLTIQSGETRKVKLHVFSDEDNLKRKIRFQIL
jgi:exoribonuclease R